MSERMTDEDWAELKDGMVQGREWWKEYGPEIADELDRARASEARLEEAERLLGRSAEMHRRGFWSSDFADQIGAFLSAKGGEPT